MVLLTRAVSKHNVIVFKNLLWTSSSTRYLFNQPSWSRLIVSGFATSSDNDKKSFRHVFTFPRPLVAIRNWMFGNMIRGYFNQDFNLKDFCNSCPLVVQQVLKCLAMEEAEDLKDSIEPELLQSIITRWNQLSVPQRNFLSNLKSDDIKCQYPTIRMRMPTTDFEEVVAFLNIQVNVMYIADAELFNRDDVKMKDFVTNWPMFHKFAFEMEVTKGVDSSWKLESCGQFPSFKYVGF